MIIGGFYKNEIYKFYCEKGLFHLMNGPVIISEKVRFVIRESNKIKYCTLKEMLWV